MKALVEFASEHGQLVAEVDDLDGEADYVRAASPGDLVGKAADRLDDALEVIQVAAHAVLRQVLALERQAVPDRVEVEFGVKLSGKVGAVLASAEGEAHLQVALTWTPGS